jgi:hypothetical protein
MAVVRLSRVFLVFLFAFVDVGRALHIGRRHQGGVGEIDALPPFRQHRRRRTRVTRGGIGQSLLAMPPLLVADVVQAVTDGAPRRPSTRLVLNGAALLTLVAAYLRRRYDAAS